ncbi:WD40 repeat domain-containing protein [Pseudoxanthobacter sp.]|uniref:WD40 repeat domain-containing protein n=1 Tax=Pseudoxanthobacter sp. TaxID=1925742 RepID=UPI002FE255DD
MATLTPCSFDSFVVAAGFLGTTPAFALGDGTVRLGTGEASRTVAAHAGGLLAAVPTQDRKALITGGDDGRVVRVTADGTATELARRERKWIDRLAAGPSGAVAFAAGRTAWVRLADGTEKTFEHPRAVGGLAFAPKGLRLAVARYDGVTLWWVNTAGDPLSLEWKGMHNTVTFSPDGRNVVTVMQENALHGWRLTDSKHMRMTGYPTRVRSIDWSVKGRLLATAGAPAAVLWPFHYKDGPMGKAPVELGFRQNVMATAVACHPEDEVVAIGYSDGGIVAGRIADGVVAMLKEGDGSPVSALTWHPDGLELAFGTEAGGAGLIDIRS